MRRLVLVVAGKAAEVVRLLDELAAAEAVRRPN